MSWLRPLGRTGIQVSALGLGTVKLGRNRGVKYPHGFDIPDARTARGLLDAAQDLGINLIDTAPAYGDAEQRLGALIRGQRSRWVLCTKVGEEFKDGRSRFDFSPEYTRLSVERSIARLQTDALDLVLVHSDGDDLRIIDSLGTLDALADLKRKGLVGAIGMSTKSVAGGVAAAAACDVVMLTYNLEQRDEEAVLAACRDLGKGALVKKALASGHLATRGADSIQASLDLVFSHPGTSAAIIGTINAHHLRRDAAAAHRAIAGSTGIA
jgi:aryl-alcohol dehydrogenase-like predicted oxidoreductase